ncbi:MAG: prepilin-type N-terminal cleavage/methylation domain-containing protein [Elusimicrobiota bacterium]|jgi:type II secretory pathway pseudopilin PulG|nr:prepilin-type N-terminal cleavage/methylation domain-containing protein [Elusimicrobiota bacterium]
MISTRPQSCYKLSFRGLTLIELLVIVLIIGILAAIALPQYNAAVLRGKLAKGMPMLKAIYEAEERHFLATGSYATNLKDLDIGLGSCIEGSSCLVNGYLYYIDINGGYIVFYPNTSAVEWTEIALLKPFHNDGWSEGTKKGRTYCLHRNNAKFKKACKFFGGKEGEVPLAYVF